MAQVSWNDCAWPKVKPAHWIKARCAVNEKTASSDCMNMLIKVRNVPYWVCVRVSTWSAARLRDESWETVRSCAPWVPE